MTDDRPELTIIPADAYWPKGGAIEQPSYSSYERQVDRAVEDAGEGCHEIVDVPERIKIAIRPHLDSKVDEFPWDSPTMCDLWANHAGKHFGHFAPSQDHENGRGELWIVWAKGGPLKVSGLPRCDHSECDHPRDYFCYGCRLPRGHEGRHSGRE
ncbi:hypothetical protein ACLF6K_24145 [Streptomyces xanthophaeus]|uniref:hypothetical protein n=1 Tax=Streptomyces xanthophaeus TaxID=67385 RepID=UPI00398FF10C